MQLSNNSKDGFLSFLEEIVWTYSLRKLPWKVLASNIITKENPAKVFSSE